MGIISFFIDVLVEKLLVWKWNKTQNVLDNGGSIAYAWLNFLSISVIYGGLAAALTVYVSPAAAGSGLAELMAYFNGINQIGFLNF